MEQSGQPVPLAGGAGGYRERLYSRYLSTRCDRPSATTVEGFRSRGPCLRRIIRRHFPPNRDAAILDLGCGHGPLVYFARKEGYRRIVGVDCSAEQVLSAANMGIEGVRRGDLFEVLKETADGSQDVVVTFDVVEHFGKKELIEFADEVLRVLKLGGKWLLHTPNAGSILGAKALFGDFTHEVAFTRESICQFLAAVGFREVRCFEDAPVVHGVLSSVRWLLWKAVRATLRLYVSIEEGWGSRDSIFSQNFLTVAVK